MNLMNLNLFPLFALNFPVMAVTDGGDGRRRRHGRPPVMPKLIGDDVPREMTSAQMKAYNRRFRLQNTR